MAEYLKIKNVEIRWEDLVKAGGSTKLLAMVLN